MRDKNEAMLFYQRVTWGTYSICNSLVKIASNFTLLHLLWAIYSYKLHLIILNQNYNKQFRKKNLLVFFLNIDTDAVFFFFQKNTVMLLMNKLIHSC